MNKLERAAPAGGLRAGASPDKPSKGTVGGGLGGGRGPVGKSGGLGGGAGNAFDNVPIGGGKKIPANPYPDDDEDDGYMGGGTAPPNTVPCRKCGRNFAEDRIGKHEKICKVNAKPKKVKMFHKPITEKEKAKMDAIKEKTSKWRAQHEEFVQAMKYNRKMTAVTAQGGNIRDMPPPPPSSQVGLVPCPYCGRKFGEAPAAKHIPACKNTVNKPKPPPGRPAPTQSYGNDYGRPAQPAYGAGSSGMGAPRQPAPTSSGYGYGNAAPRTTGVAAPKAQPTNTGFGRGNSGEFGGYGGMGGGMGGASKPTGQNAPVRPSGGMGGGIGGGIGGGLGGMTAGQGSNYRKKF